MKIMYKKDIIYNDVRHKRYIAFDVDIVSHHSGDRY